MAGNGRKNGDSLKFKDHSLWKRARGHVKNLDGAIWEGYTTLVACSIQAVTGVVSAKCVIFQLYDADA